MANTLKEELRDCLSDIAKDSGSIKQDDVEHLLNMICCKVSEFIHQQTI